MIRFELGFGVIVFALWVFCVIDVINTPEGATRNLPKVGWLILVLLFPLVGSVAWLAAGRPQSAPRAASRYERSAPTFPEYDRPGRAAGTTSEADEDFLRQCRERAEEQRRRYQQRRAEETPDGEAG